ncbi:MAG: 16S rRNA (adenine(1518)-N(6)/adenine(1519)-N(6))-dimethyltransferase RsmA [Phycisphaerales bacterium]
MQSLTDIKALLAGRGIRPKHRFGQNFLHDHNQLKKLVHAANVQPGELVLEVGPGTGTLTETLLEAGANVIACEIDPDMQAIVRERTAAYAPDRFRLVAGDCLDGKRSLSAELVTALDRRPFVLVANLPYGAASPLMAVLASRYPECRGQFVTVQKEVGDRIRAEPGTRDYGPLTVIMQLFATIREIAVVKPGSFWPAPDVTSAMIAIEPTSKRPFATDAELDAFESFLHTVFSKRRKQLGAILGRDVPWPRGIEPEMRPEVLGVDQLLGLARVVASGHRSHGTT